jgi:internalin A
MFDRFRKRVSSAIAEGAHERALERIANSQKALTLDLSGIGLPTLPPDIGNLTKLESLKLNQNQLTSLPREIGNLTSLTYLDLSENQLTSLPSEIGNLTSLRYLYLNTNQLTSLPSEIGNLSNLTYLYLNTNQLTSLPSEIGNLRGITMLPLWANQLVSLPSQISNLTNLTQLNLSGNQLESLPDAIRSLNHLSDLKLHGNPGLGIPDSILEGRPRDILNFYFAQRQAAAQGTLQPLNEIKVMLLGDGGAGKTSLRRFFKGEAHSEKEEETLGIVLDTFTLNSGPTDITIRLWDFAGQEITHALHQFFLTEGCIYLVVVQPRSDNEQSDAEKWLKLIERYGKGAPALVVLNKQDTRKPSGYDVDRNLLGERFPFIRHFQPTMCGKSREGCDELLEKLRGVVVSTPQARPHVPESWLRVKDECFEKGKDGKERQYLSLDEFRDLCAKHGEPEKEKQESLARILHNLGAVLHFIDEPRLRDTSVLNPHWVTDGAYRLLRFKDRPNSDGILTLSEAVEAVPGADEPAARYLLNLMERFEMCFPLDADDDASKPAERWLVPGSLDKKQPDQIRIAEWQDPKRVRLRYTYDPLPQSVIPRLIVMTHAMSEGQPRWRNGVVLVDGPARALIRKAQNDNTVEVIVQGEEQDRDKLVKVLRGYFAHIHRDLADPKPREWQELAGLPDEFREIRQMRADERRNVPIVVETKAGDVEKNPTKELNRSSAEAPRKSNKRPLRVFLSYSQKDRKKHAIFRNNLIALQSDGYITFWDDPNIQPDMEWRDEIDRELEAMDIFIGLLTTNFAASNFIQRVEFRRAMERREDQEKPAKMWLILVDDRRIQGTKVEGIQVVKPGGKSVSKYKSLQAGFDAVEKELFPLVKELWEKQPQPDQLSRQEA